MPKQESLIHSILKTAGISLSAGAAYSAYRGLTNADSPLRAVVMEGVANKVGYAQIKDDPFSIDAFKYQLPGIWRTSAISASIVAEPKTDWNTISVFRDSLVTQDSGLDEELAHHRLKAFCIEARQADQQRLPGLFVVREQAEPVETIQIPFSADTYSVSTVRYFLVGQDYLPPILRTELSKH